MNDQATVQDVCSASAQVLTAALEHKPSDHRRRQKITKVKTILRLARNVIDPDFGAAQELTDLFTHTLACLRGARERDIKDAITILKSLDEAITDVKHT